MSKNKQAKAEAAPKADKVKNSARSVARKTVAALRRDRQANPAVADVIKSWQFKQSIMARKNDNSPEVKRLREKFEREEFVNNRACELFEQYRSACDAANADVQARNLNNLWAQAVQAVKTDTVGTFQNKWGDKVRKVKNAA